MCSSDLWNDERSESELIHDRWQAPTSADDNLVTWFPLDGNAMSGVTGQASAVLNNGAAFATSADSRVANTTWTFNNGQPIADVWGNSTIYRLTPNVGTWEEAKEQAFGMDGQLVRIDNAIENTVVKNLANGRNVWIGGSRDDQGTLRWLDGQSIGAGHTYSNWGVSEPNNVQGSENAVQMRPDGFWNDLPSRRVYHLDGVDDYLDLPDVALGNDLTVEADVWVDKATNWARVLDIGNGPADNNILLALEPTTGRLRFEAYNGNRSLGVIETDTAFPTGQIGRAHV